MNYRKAWNQMKVRKCRKEFPCALCDVPIAKGEQAFCRQSGRVHIACGNMDSPSALQPEPKKEEGPKERQAYHDKLPHGSYDYSPTGLGLYIMCPSRYGKKYDERIKGVPGPGALVGKEVHRALDIVTAERLTKCALEWDPTWLQKPVPLEELVEAFGEPDLAPALTEAAIEVLEKLDQQLDLKHAIHSEHPVWARVGGVTIGGIVDRVDSWHDEEGTHRVDVVDYKTGLKVKNRAELEMDPQALAYMEAARAKWPNAIIRFVCWYVRPNLKVHVVYRPALRQRLFRMVNWVHQKAGRDRDFTPTVGAHCSHCPYAFQCDAFLKSTEDMISNGFETLFDPAKLDAFLATRGLGAVLSMRDHLKGMEKMAGEKRKLLDGKLKELAEQQGTEVLSDGGLMARVKYRGGFRLTEPWTVLSIIGGKLEGMSTQDVLKATCDPSPAKIKRLLEGQKRPDLLERIAEYTTDHVSNYVQVTRCTPEVENVPAGA